MPTKKLCCLFSCRNNSLTTRRANARYFSIPSTQFYASKWRDWIAWQNSPAEATLKCSYVCDEHFEKSCILPTGKLLVGSVPSKSLKHVDPLQASAEIKTENVSEQTISIQDLLSSGEKVLSCNQPKSWSRPIKHFEWSSLLTSRPENENIVIPREAQNTGSVDSHNYWNLENITTPSLSVAAVNPVAEALEAGAAGTAVHSTPTQRAKRYLGDLSPSDFSTPKRAKKFLDLATNTVAKYKKKLYAERARRRRLQRKVKTLEDHIRRLK